MNGYTESHSVARLIGTPLPGENNLLLYLFCKSSFFSGCTDFLQDGELTEAVQRKPYAVIVFDDPEKAHPQIWNSLLQVLNECHLTVSLASLFDLVLR
jgi:ATP-dependent Clp protease ATP-binding subunit ClpA